MPPIGDLVLGARFLRRLPAFLRRPVTVPEARAALRQRFERREADFLRLVRWAVYGHAASPYRPLLKGAGCEYGDLERLVEHEGVEGALGLLLRQGVYLTMEEFKGRQPVVRGSTRFSTEPTRFWNPASTAHLLTRTGGSTGTAIAVPVDLASTRDHAVDLSLFLDARSITGLLHAIWGVPGGSGMTQILRFAGCGIVPVRWFSQVDPLEAGLHPRYRWSARAMAWGSAMAGVSLPTPRHVPLSDPLPIARWMGEVLASGRPPHLWAFASSAVRLCQVADEAGIRLAGAHFTIGSEPVTEARVAVIRDAGCEVISRYASSECGPIGYGCLAPEAPDDVHLLSDLHAVIRSDRAGPPDSHADTLWISSLRRTARMILLNVSLGDSGLLVRRSCGCPLEAQGWTTHLHTIRGAEKLTAGGMAFLDLHVIPVLEKVLPARFGGGPTDYQLIEEEAEDGRSRLRLLVHPGVGPVDPTEIARVFLDSISTGPGVERVMGLAWRDADLVRVERQTPMATASEKILPVHHRWKSVRRRSEHSRS